MNCLKLIDKGKEKMQEKNNTKISESCVLRKTNQLIILRAGNKNSRKAKKEATKDNSPKQQFEIPRKRKKGGNSFRDERKNLCRNKSRT